MITVFSDAVLLVFGLVGIIAIAIALYVITKPTPEQQAELERQRRREARQDAAIAVQAAGIGRRGRRRRRNARDRGEEGGGDEDGEEEEEEVEEVQVLTREERKLRQKEAKKKAREEARLYAEAERREREGRKLSAYDQKRLDREKEFEDRERPQERRSKEQVADDKRVRDELSGLSAVEREEALQRLLSGIVDYMKEHKVAVLADLAAEFKLSARETIAKVKQLEAEGKINGVVDDKGRFINITRDEMVAVAAFIKRRGRVSIADIALESTRLIDFTGRGPVVQTALPPEEDDKEVDSLKSGVANGGGSGNARGDEFEADGDIGEGVEDTAGVVDVQCDGDGAVGQLDRDSAASAIT